VHSPARHRISLACALGAALAGLGCGARSDLAGLAPPLDAGRASTACTLESTDVVAPFESERAEGALVVARAGGFDVGSFLVDRGPAYTLLRVEIASGRASLGARANVGLEASSVGALGVRGSRLVLCFGDRDLEGPTRWVRTDALDYADRRTFDLGTGGGDHCGPIVAGEDRWLVAWQDRRPASFGWSVAEADDDGRILAEISHDPERGLFDAIATGPGFVWLALDPSDRRSLEIVERAAGTPVVHTSLHLGGSYAIEHASIASSPDEAGGREISIVDARGVASIAWLDARWGVRASASVDGTTTYGAARLLALRGRRLAALAECVSPRGAGRLAVYDVSEAGGATLVLTVMRDACPTRLAAAVDGPAALAWIEGSTSRVMGLDCR
jgi:hypothetical protein